MFILVSIFGALYRPKEVALIKKKEGGGGGGGSKYVTFKAVFLISGTIQFTPASWNSKSRFALVLLCDVLDDSYVSNDTAYQHDTVAQ